MTVYLIRHAHAGARSAWNDDDRLRPLSPKGNRTAEAIAGALGDRPVVRVLSSPAVRCIETIEPLAAKVGQPIETSEPLAEGGDAVEVIRLMRSHAGGDLAMCSHGDVIPEVIEILARSGVDIAGDVGNRKGSFWAIELNGSSSSARYHDRA
jgi:8-oxo-dGTP diphosphatase